MLYCKYCGKTANDNEVSCSNCGNPLRDRQQSAYQQQAYQQQYQQQAYHHQQAYQQNAYQQYSQPNYYHQQPRRRKQLGIPITSLALGVFGIIFAFYVVAYSASVFFFSEAIIGTLIFTLFFSPLSIVGLVLGHKGRQLGGRPEVPLATAGFICSIVGLGLYGFAFIMAFNI